MGLDDLEGDGGVSIVDPAKPMNPPVWLCVGGVGGGDVGIEDWFTLADDEALRPQQMRQRNHSFLLFSSSGERDRNEAIKVRKSFVYLTSM